MKQVITREEVATAMSGLSAKNGKKATLAALHAALGGRGSMTTLIRLKNELETAAQGIVDSDEGLKAFREVWALALQEGRQQQEAVITELRDNLQTVLIENEKLEGVAASALERVASFEEAKARADAVSAKTKADLENQLSQERTAVIRATEQARQALEQLAQEQANRASEVAGLRSELDKAVGKAHTLELELVRARALLEPRDNKVIG
jgi:hypothetical protein